VRAPTEKRKQGRPRKDFGRDLKPNTEERRERRDEIYSAGRSLVDLLIGDFDNRAIKLLLGDDIPDAELLRFRRAIISARQRLRRLKHQKLKKATRTK
jgi:hypothetical protein